MSCDDILLHLQGYPDQTAPEAIDAALTVARGLSGKISALAVELSVAYMPNQLVDQVIGLKGIAEEAEQRSSASCRDAVDYFRDRAGAAGLLHGVEVVSADMGLEALRRARESRTFDFSIYCPTAGGLDKVLAETLILLSGRPVLVLPPGHPGRLDRVVVAWDGSAPVARAMNEALPLLRAAQSVKVLTIGGDKPSDHVAPWPDAVRHLLRHGVRAEGCEVEPEGLSTAAALEGRLEAEPADLVVMGAFGHSRLREIVLGGVTEHMLSRTPTAVWLSH
ncbi:MAG: universal stress protein [Caulobacteraceae bacterium]